MIIATDKSKSAGVYGSNLKKLKRITASKKISNSTAPTGTSSPDLKNYQ